MLNKLTDGELDMGQSGSVGSTDQKWKQCKNAGDAIMQLDVTE